MELLDKEYIEDTVNTYQVLRVLPKDVTINPDLTLDVTGDVLF